MRRLSAFACVAATLAACTPVEPPKTPAERHARIAEAADIAFDRCGQFMMGGFSSATELRAARDKHRQLATEAGASQAVFTKAKADVQSGFEQTAIWSNPQAACNSLLTHIAREA